MYMLFVVLPCIAHHLPVVMLDFDFFEAIVRNLAWSRGGVVLAIPPLRAVIQWCINIILLILILILLCWIINHYWLIRLVVFSNASIYGGFAYFVIIRSLHLYHVLHLVEIGEGPTLTSAWLVLLDGLCDILPIFC